MTQWLGFVIPGLSAGIISGTLGVGSGLVLVPALVLLFDFYQKSAQAVSLAVMAAMALVGALRYIQNPAIRVDMRVVALIVPGAPAGAILGAHWAGVLAAVTLRRLFAVFLPAVALRILLVRPRPPSTATLGEVRTEHAGTMPYDSHSSE